MREALHRPSLNREEYKHAITPLLDQLFNGRSLADATHAQPLVTDDPIATRHATLTAADIAHDLIPDFPTPPLPRRYEHQALWATVDTDIANLQATNQKIREENRNAAQARTALEGHREHMRSSIGRRALARLFGETYSFKGDLHSPQGDRPEYDIPDEIIEPVLIGSGTLYSRRQEVVLFPSHPFWAGPEDTLTFTENGLEATFGIGDQEFACTLVDRGPKLTVESSLHNSEGYLAGRVRWDCYPNRGFIEKYEIDKLGRMRPNADTHFGHYITDYSSDVATLSEVIAVAQSSIAQTE